MCINSNVRWLSIVKCTFSLRNNNSHYNVFIKFEFNGKYKSLRMKNDSEQNSLKKK